MIGNLIAKKSTEFAVRIVKLNRYLRDEKKEFVISDQVYRSGMSIGANVREGIYAQSRSDFISKMSIALKEASETEYWLEVLSESGYLDSKQYESLQNNCSELIKMLIATVKKSKTEK